MKKQTKIILGSAMTMALCASLIAGSTFALFTSESEVNVAITSGKVDVMATVDESTLKGFSAEWQGDAYQDEIVEGTFTDGGTYAYDTETNQLTLDRIVAGDGVEFDLKVTNKSSIAIRYQVRLTMSKDDAALAEDLAIYVATEKEDESWKAFGDPLTLSAGEIFASSWSASVAPAGESSELTGAHVRVQLPIDAEQPKDAEGNPVAASCALTVGVLAVQANGATCEETGEHDYRDGEHCYWCGQRNPFVAHHTETDDTYTITGVDDGVSELTIPGEINGKAVEIGANAFKGRTDFTSVTIEEGVTKIGDNAFNKCSNLENANIPETVTELGQNAFSYCLGLTSVTFAEGCALTKISNSAFRTCQKLRSIDIPDSVTVIGTYAFTNCSHLESVHLPDSLTSIDRDAFENCYSLNTITIPKGVTRIDRLAFSHCYRLVEIINHSTLTLQKGTTGNGFIAQYALGIETAPDAQSKIVLDNDFYYYMGEEGTYMVDYVGSEANLTLPETAPGGKPYTINGHAFYATTVVSTLTIPRNMTEIPDEAFISCTYLKGITFLGDITSIGANAFSGCMELSEITISESVTTIGDRAFFGCFKLEHVTIPATVTSIGDLAFTSVKTITYTGTRVQWDALNPTQFLDHNTKGVAESSWQRCTVTITGETEPVELKYVAGKLQS